MATAGVLPEEPRLPTSSHQSQYLDVEPVSGNVRTRPPMLRYPVVLGVPAATQLLLGP